MQRRLVNEALIIEDHVRATCDNYLISVASDTRNIENRSPLSVMVTGLIVTRVTLHGAPYVLLRLFSGCTDGPTELAQLRRKGRPPERHLREESEVTPPSQLTTGWQSSQTFQRLWPPASTAPCCPG